MGAEYQPIPVAGRLQFHLVHHLPVTAIKALRHAQQGRSDADGAPCLGRQRRELPIRLLRPTPSVRPRHQRDGFHFLWLESPQPAVVDQVVRVPVMADVRDVAADVVQ